MDFSGFALSRAPMALAPAVRLVEPVVLSPVQEALLPWPAPEPALDDGSSIPPMVQRIVGQLTAATVEVLRGRRPLEHLAGHAVADVHDLIGHLRRALPLNELRLASLRLGQPSDRVVEAAARLSLGRRSRAAALCFARQRDDEVSTGWRLTHLELGLDPPVILRAG